MDVIPPAQVARFEQMNPGDLFLYIDGRKTFYALKTAQPSNGAPCCMVLLGPTFIQDAAESLLLPWQPATVLSFGKIYSILLPTDPASWSRTGPNRTPVCLAVAGENTYICTNGGMHPEPFFQCFVDVMTGAIIQGYLPGTAVFTNNWEIAVLTANHPPRSILKYPLR
jgi:hypothetical protein